MKRLIAVAALLVLVALAVLWLGGHGKKGAEVFGEPVAPQAIVARIQDIVQNQQAYRDKIVVAEGRIGAVGCLDCGGVIVTDKTWRLPVEPEDPSKFRIPVKRGAPIKVWGVVHVEGAEEGSRETAETESEKHEAEQAELSLVEIKATGVEIR